VTDRVRDLFRRRDSIKSILSIPEESEESDEKDEGKDVKEEDIDFDKWLNAMEVCYAFYSYFRVCLSI
jgi:hypothetical protein